MELFFHQRVRVEAEAEVEVVVPLVRNNKKKTTATVQDKHLLDYGEDVKQMNY